MNIIQITHYYSLLTKKYFIQTEKSIEEVNLICAYLQLIREDLPCMNALTDDDLTEDFMVEILAKFYDCQKIVSKRNIDNKSAAVIDLYDNWEEYALKADVDYLNQNFARKGIYKAVIEQILLEARESCGRHPKDLEKERLEQLEQLEFIKKGGNVPQSWKLRTLSGSDYTGSISHDDISLVKAKFKKSHK